MKKRWIILVLITLLFVVVISLAFADGTEKLGPIDIESGTGMVAAGTGMLTGSGTIVVPVPDGVTIKQVLLYWEGKMDPDLPGDDPDTIEVNDWEEIITGERIGGPTLDFPGAYSSSFRADITKEFVTSGDTTLTLKGLNFSLFNDGAGVLVIYEGSGLDADIQLFDGLDLAFQGWADDDPPKPKERYTTEPKTFKFKASTEKRTAQLSMFVASVDGPASRGGKIRPYSIEVTVAGDTKVTSYYEDRDSKDGHEWDTITQTIPIPANANSLTVEVFSRDDKNTENLPASLAWIAAGLMVPPPPPPDHEVDVSKICTSDVFVGDEIEYEITVRNTGDENLTDVVVIDPLLELEVEIDSLAIGASSTITDTMIAADTDVITNTVTVTATGEIAGQVTDTDSCATEVYKLKVTKDAQTSLVRRYIWEIDKWVKASKEAEFKKSIDLTVFPTQVVSPTYKVKVDLVKDNLGNPKTVDSNWVVSGTITITNPAPMDAPLSAVTDVIPDFHLYLPLISKGGGSQNAGAGQNHHINSALPGISAPVDCPSYTVPAGETLVCTYGPVDLSSGLTRTNTAFAELKNTVGGVFSGTTVFSGTAQIDFTNAEVELIDEEVIVEDQRKWIDGWDVITDLGTVNVCDISDCDNGLPAPPFKNKTFDYKLEMPSFSEEECRRKQVPNTATFTTNDTKTKDSDSATVNLFCFATSSIGFEDLPMVPIDGNDWDYNDAFFKVSFNDPYPTFDLISNDLISMTFNFTQTVNGSVNTHEFYIQPDVFKCNGTYTLTRNNEVIIPVEDPEDYNNGDPLLIFDDTKLGKPDEVCAMPEDSDPPPNTATLVINFDEAPSPGACPLDLSGFDPIGTFNGEGLFYVPFLTVKSPCNKKDPWPTKWYDIKPRSSPDPEKRIVSVPATWDWPEEKQPIWEKYTKVKKPDPGAQPPLTPTFCRFWWNPGGPNC